MERARPLREGRWRTGLHAQEKGGVVSKGELVERARPVREGSWRTGLHALEKGDVVLRPSSQKKKNR